MIDPVKSVLIFISRTTLLRWLTFLLGSQPVTLTVLIFWISFFLLMLVFVPQCLSLHWVILVMLLSVSIDFPNSQRDAPFHRIAYDYSRTDWDGLCYHLSDVSWEDIIKLSVSAAAIKFCEWVQVGIDAYISLIVSIRSSLTHLHGFQLLVLLP